MLIASLATSLAASPDHAVFAVLVLWSVKVTVRVFGVSEVGVIV